MRDELERPVGERQRGCVGLLKLDARAKLLGQPAARFGEHPFGEVGADDLGVWELARDRTRTCARPGAQIKRTCRRSGQRLQPGFVRRERILELHRPPHGRERVELPTNQRPEETPGARIPDGGIGRQPRELPPDCFADHDGSRWMRTSWPDAMPNIAAAFPPLIAIDRFRYESSYRIRSPGRASANVRAATA